MEIILPILFLGNISPTMAIKAKYSSEKDELQITHEVTRGIETPYENIHTLRVGDRFSPTAIGRKWDAGYHLAHGYQDWQIAVFYAICHKIGLQYYEGNPLRFEKNSNELTVTFTERVNSGYDADVVTKTINLLEV